MEPTNPFQANSKLDSNVPQTDSAPATDIQPTAPTVSDVAVPDTVSPTPNLVTDIQAPTTSATATAPTLTAEPTQTQPSTVSSSTTAFTAPEVSSPVVSDSPQTVTVGQGGDVTTPPVMAGTTGGSKKKWLVPAVAAAALTLLLGGGYVFGMYLPNRPQAVFNKSLVQSGAAADKLVEYSQKQMTAKYAGATMDGTLTVKSSGMSVDATMTGKSDAKNSELTINADIAGQKMTADFRMLDVASSESPDIYLKVSGVKQLLEQLGGAKMGALDSQWIAIDHTLVDSYQKQLEGSSGASLSAAPTTEQINDATAKFQTVNKQYLFTSDSDKAVLKYQSFVGKETKNGRTVNHYKAGYSKEHLKAYVDAMAKALDSSKLNDWAKSQNDGKNISALLNTDSLKTEIDKNKGDETFDVYVDTSSKLMQSVAFTSKDSNSEKTVMTISQNYTGGDSYPMELAIKTGGDKEGSNITLGMTADTKTNKLQIAVKGEQMSAGDPMTLSMKANIVPSDKTVTLSAPTGAKPVMDVMKQLGLDQSVLGAQTVIPSSLLNVKTQ